jgi:hypothetical protein
VIIVKTRKAIPICFIWYGVANAKIDEIIDAKIIRPPAKYAIVIFDVLSFTIGEKYTLVIVIETIVKSKKPRVEYENDFIILVFSKYITVTNKTTA